MPPKKQQRGGTSGGEPKTGLVVTLVFFILATIGLGVTTYMFYADQDKHIKAAKEAQAATIRLQLKPDGLELTATTQDVGQAHEDLDAKYEGTEMTIAFNPDFLLDGIEAVDGDEVSLETVDALKPAVVRSVESQDYLYLLMPVRVS